MFSFFFQLVGGAISFAWAIAFVCLLYFQVRLTMESPNVAFLLLLQNPGWLSKRGQHWRRRWFQAMGVVIAIPILASLILELVKNAAGIEWE